MEEKKTYTVVGTVTIGTDEYRDLIEGLCEAKKETDRMRSQWVEQYNKAKALEEKLNELQPRYNELTEFVHSQKGILSEFKLWKIGERAGE